MLLRPLFSDSVNTTSLFFIGSVSSSRKAPKFIPVVWEAPPLVWVKVNTDDSFVDFTRAGYGGLFRNSMSLFIGLFIGGFSYNAMMPSAIDVEVFAIIDAKCY